MKTAIALGTAWTCENLDTLAPITEQFTAALFDDGTTGRYNGEPIATEQQRLEYAHKQGFVTVGDLVKVTKGRKMVGQVKTVTGFSRYYVPGTYGHKYTNYLHFDDGTKVNMQNCRVVGFENVEYLFEFKGFRVGGRW